jgi:hypothetical protein
MDNKNKISNGVNIYITNKFVKNIRYLPVLFPILGPLKDEKRLFADLGDRAFKKPVFNLVADIDEADFVLFPHDFYYFMIGMISKEYLDEHVLFSQKHKKKLLIFDLSDLTDREINVPNSIVFRVAGYMYRQKENEITMPYFVEDLSKYQEITWRKKGEKPVIGFCGWAALKNKKQKIKFWLKTFLMSVRIFLSPDRNLEAHRQGIYFRMKAIKILEKCNNIFRNFIIRKSYSSHKTTIELPVEEARKQYIENISNSDFTLCTKGDSNSSYRFFEILSLGKIPLVVNTDCTFPLKNVLDYSKFSVFIDYRNLDNICEVIKDFYSEISDEDFIQMQKTARTVFEKYLNANAFLSYILPILAEKERKNFR